MKFNSVSALSSDYDAARRIAYTMAKVADRFGVPLHPYSPESLLQSAMEQPETITPQEYRLIYAMRSTEAPQ